MFTLVLSIELPSQNCPQTSALSCYPLVIPRLFDFSSLSITVLYCEIGFSVKCTVVKTLLRLLCYQNFYRI